MINSKNIYKTLQVNIDYLGQFLPDGNVLFFKGKLQHETYFLDTNHDLGLSLTEELQDNGQQF